MKRIMNYPHLMKIVILASGVMIAGSILMLIDEMSRHQRFETCAYLYVPTARRGVDELGKSIYVPLYKVRDGRMSLDMALHLIEEVADYCGLELGEPPER